MHDTLLQVQNAGLNVRKPLKVQFFGEEGVDEGGVQKVRPPARVHGGRQITGLRISQAYLGALLLALLRTGRAVTGLTAPSQSACKISYSAFPRTSASDEDCHVCKLFRDLAVMPVTAPWLPPP